MMNRCKRILCFCCLAALSLGASKQLHAEENSRLHASENKQLRAEEYRNAVKITFLSWITGSTKLSYERALPHHQSAEICASMIGAGFDKFHNHPRGYTLRYGHKFFFPKTQIAPLEGFYLRPEVIYSHYHYTPKSAGTTPTDANNRPSEAGTTPTDANNRPSEAGTTPTDRELAAMTTILATGGCQYQFGRLLVDAWLGAGPAWGIPAETGYHHGFKLWGGPLFQHTHLALSFSIKLGYCF